MRASLNSTILFSGTQTSKPLRALTRSIRYVLYAPLRKKRRQPKDIVDGEGRTESEEWLVVSHAIHHTERERERLLLVANSPSSHEDFGLSSFLQRSRDLASCVLGEGAQHVLHREILGRPQERQDGAYHEFVS